MATINTATMTRDEYVAFRAVWKNEYKALSLKIRNLKRDIKNTMRSGGYAGNEQPFLGAYAFDARHMLETLAEAKAKLKTLTDEVARAA